ncbi:hypothetical protein [Xanthomonas campestris]|uniref:hypothetical protein n=1 Tax=Xanthomonas campestris TaxID=339 RepID=UPI003CFBC2A3
MFPLELLPPLVAYGFFAVILVIAFSLVWLACEVYQYWRFSTSAEQRQRDFLTAACLGIAAVQGVAIAYAPLDVDSRQMNLQFEDVLP